MAQYTCNGLSDFPPGGLAPTDWRTTGFLFKGMRWHPISAWGGVWSTDCVHSWRATEVWEFHTDVDAPWKTVHMWRQPVASIREGPEELSVSNAAWQMASPVILWKGMGGMVKHQWCNRRPERLHASTGDCCCLSLRSSSSGLYCPLTSIWVCSGCIPPEGATESTRRAALVAKQRQFREVSYNALLGETLTRALPLTWKPIWRAWYSRTCVSISPDIRTVRRRFRQDTFSIVF